MRAYCCLALLLVGSCADDQLDETDISSTQAAIFIITGRCPASALQLYSAANFGGSRLCLGGYGVMTLPAGWQGAVRSFKAGIYGGDFESQLFAGCHFTPGTSHPNPNNSVKAATTVHLEIMDSDGGITLSCD